MVILKGKQKLEISKDEFEQLVSGYKELIIDIGTGNGKFVYNLGKKNPQNFYIGLDPNQNALEEISAKLYKKPEKGGLTNCLFVISTLENLPEELDGKIDKIYINFPWAALLRLLLNPEKEVLDNLKRISIKDAELNIFFNHSSKYEPIEMEKQGIIDLTPEFIEKELKPKYLDSNILINSYSILTNEEMKKMDAYWGKKLGYGRKRDVWNLKCRINPSGETVKEIVDDPTKDALNYSFTAKGNSEVLATHPKTLEINKDNFLTERGDCIIGISSNFDQKELQKFKDWVEIYLKSGDKEDKVKCFVNPLFNSNTEFVIRKSKFGSDRTFGIIADKGSNKLNRELIEELKKGTDLQVTITQKVKRIHKNKYKN